MTVLNGAHNLFKNFARVFLWQLPFCLDILHELASAGQLHDHDKLFSLHEGVVELHNVLVAQPKQTVRLLVDVADLVSVCH